jgi:hypothetical protein
MKGTAMKREVIKVRVDPVGRSRAHAMLFNGDLPFRGRREQRRDTYRRRDKHVRRSFAEM